MIRRFKLGRDVELHKRTLERGLLSLVGPAGARARRGRRTLPERRARPPRGRVGGAPVRLVATDLGVDVLCAAEDAERGRRRADRGRRRAGRPRPRPRSAAWRAAARATASTSTTP